MQKFISGKESFLHAININKGNGSMGVYSVCSSHPWVLETSMEFARAHNTALLIESTCNQVNHQGGYTGMIPKAFIQYVHDIADRVGYPKKRLILGGDHLGPNPWKHLQANDALKEAHTMIQAYALAGYEKIHLDASMACADDNASVLSDTLIAARAAALCCTAEQYAQQAGTTPVYVIGTEVPTPGGVQGNETLHITTVDDVQRTIEINKQAFIAAGIEHVWERVIGVVVQPGVEFGDQELISYQPALAQSLAQYIANGNSHLVYEAHSTDYQSSDALAALAHDRFAILKVGPWLTFAMREALFALAHIERVLYESCMVTHASNLINTVTDFIYHHPQHWAAYYMGTEHEKKYAIQYSMSDRIRYYWNEPAIQQCVQSLLQNLDAIQIPRTLASQFLQYEGEPCSALHHIKAKIAKVLQHYHKACT